MLEDEKGQIGVVRRQGMAKTEDDEDVSFLWGKRQ